MPACYLPTKCSQRPGGSDVGRREPISVALSGWIKCTCPHFESIHVMPTISRPPCLLIKVARLQLTYRTISALPCSSQELKHRDPVKRVRENIWLCEMRHRRLLTVCTHHPKVGGSKGVSSTQAARSPAAA